MERPADAPSRNAHALRGACLELGISLEDQVADMSLRRDIVNRSEKREAAALPVHRVLTGGERHVSAAARSALATMPPAASAEDGRYATITEMRAALGDLRQDLAKHQGPGNVMVMEAMRDGQTDLANRISDLAAKVDRLERTLNSSRKAHP